MADTEVPSHADYKQYYYNCFCLYEDKIIRLSTMETMERLHYFELGEVGYKPYMRYEVPYVQKMTTAESIFRNKKPFVPSYGYIATSDKSVAYVALSPKKQFYRDFSPTRLNIRVPNPGETGTYRCNDHDYEALPVILRNNHLFSVETALEKLFNGDLLGVPVSLDYALVATLTHKDAVLFRKNRMIGTVDRKGLFTAKEKEFYSLPNIPNGIKRADQ